MKVKSEEVVIATKTTVETSTEERMQIAAELGQLSEASNGSLSRQYPLLWKTILAIAQGGDLVT